jgi:hypothetical protein
MRYYYTDVANQPQGPVELTELQALVRAGSIPRSAQVCAEGASEWRPIEQVVALPAVPAASFGGIPLSDILASFYTRVLALVRSALGGQRLVSVMSFFSRTGSFLLLIGAALTVIWSVVAAVRTNNAYILGGGVGAAILLLILQFTAQRFLTAGRELVENSRTTVNSTAVMDCLALLLVTASVGTLLTGIIATIQTSSLTALVLNLVLAVALLAVAALCLSPDVVRVSVQQSTAGEEAMGVLSFFLKAGLFVMPLVYFVAGVLGCLAVLVAFSDSGAMLAHGLASALPLGWFQFFQVPIGVTLLLAGAMVPVLSYFWFLSLYLPLDVIQAIVSLPAKLNRTQH